jgi:transposase-like protein
MVRPGREQLFGYVEVDETYLGGLEEGVRGRKTRKKVLIVVAAEEDGHRIGRIRIRRATSASAADLQKFISEAVAPGSVVRTDGWSGYWGLDKKGYVHDVTQVKPRRRPGPELLPRAHRVVSLLKRWLLGTHQGAVSPEHLDYYLDEFTFRFNRRTSRHRGKLFYRLLQNAVSVDPAPYHSLVRHLRGRPATHHNI